MKEYSQEGQESFPLPDLFVPELNYHSLRMERAFNWAKQYTGPIPFLQALELRDFGVNVENLTPKSKENARD